jgi:hypothetical protein
MATTKPRITVTLTKRQHEVFTSISASSGQSMSSLIGEIMPTFERMATTFQKLRATQDNERAKVAQVLEEAQNALEPIALAAVGQFDLFMGKVESAAGAGGPERSEDRTAPAARPAPTTNRGATPKRAKTAKPTAATVSGVSLPSKKSKTRRMPTA